MGESELFCPNCGNAVEEGNAFCPNCGAQITGSPVTSGAPNTEKYSPTAKTRPRTGYILSLVGGALTLLSGIGYLVLGNPVVGVLGIIFGILIITLSRRLHMITDRKEMGLFGFVPFLIGWFLLIASGTLLPFDLVVSIAGFLTIVGSSGMFAGK